MKTHGTTFQIALVLGAIVIGVLLDRLLLAGMSPARDRSPAVAETTSSSSGNPTAADTTRTATSGIPRSSEAAPAARDSATTGQSLDSILSQREPRQRLRELQAYISGISPAEYPDALRRIRQITRSNERELASRLIVAQWVQDDPDGALQFAAGNRGFEYVAEDVFQQFAATDVDAALERAKGIPGDDLRYRALRGVLGYKADSDPQGALKLAQELGSEFRVGEPLTNSVYRQWAATDPQAAALHAAESGQGEGWRSPVMPVVHTWAQQDPLAAANWSLSLEDPRAQSRSVSQVMQQWSRNDAQAAANWIHSLQPGPSRDAAVAGMAQSLVSRDPQTALSWIGTINDDNTRNRTLQRISSAVMWRDPQNGAAMLQAAGLPADQIRGRGRRRQRE